ncbi:MAG: hypothetical protein WC707_03005 [Candidatus Babeliaceae bacterium]|jgi:hypothetical protein
MKKNITRLVIIVLIAGQVQTALSYNYWAITHTTFSCAYQKAFGSWSNEQIALGVVVAVSCCGFYRLQKQIKTLTQKIQAQEENISQANLDIEDLKALNHLGICIKTSLDKSLESVFETFKKTYGETHSVSRGMDDSYYIFNLIRTVPAVTTGDPTRASYYTKKNS